MSKYYTSTTKFRITCKCLVCGKIYKCTVPKIDSVDPPCPSKLCIAARTESEIKRRAENMASILAQSRAPGHVGSITAKSIDFTNELVATDYGLTDLKDRVKVGESSAPRLSPVLQEQADNFFGGGSLRQNPMLAARISSIGAAAAAGAFAPKPNAPVSQGGHIIDQVMGAKKIAPYKVIASDRR